MQSTSQDASDPLFRVQSCHRLTQKHIESLIAGTVAAVHIPNYISSVTCRNVITALSEMALTPYDLERVNPPIARFGPVLNDYRKDGSLSAEYWPHVVTARNAWANVGFEPDPLASCIARFAEAWPGDVRSATSGRQILFAGMIREINQGALMHYDELVREYPSGILDEGIIAQLAFNAYLATPELGGETIIWRRRWNPDDEKVRHGYGYNRSITDKCRHVEIKPSTGDAIIFDPRNYHAVNPGMPGTRRITLSYFLGLTARGEILLWS